MQGKPREQSLLEANAGFYEAFSSLDLEAMGRLWLQAEDVVCVHPGWAPLYGWVAVRESWRRIFENTERMAFVLADARATLEDGGSVGHVDVIENICGHGDGGRTLAAAAARNSFRWLDGHWLMTAHLATPS
jgi:ketosteroid isomerase-like protein